MSDELKIDDGAAATTPSPQPQAGNPLANHLARGSASRWCSSPSPS